MAGDHPTPGTGDMPGGRGPQEADNRGVSLGRKPGGVDPAAVADQMTQLDGSAVPGQGAPGAPVPGQAAPGAPMAPSAPPAAGAPGAPGSEYAYAPTAAAFPAQTPPPAPGAPVGPYDPTPGPFPQQQVAQAGAPYGYTAPPQAGGFPQQAPGYGYPGAPVPAAPVAPAKRNTFVVWGSVVCGVLAVAIIAGLVVLFGGDDKKDDPVASTGGTSSGTTGGGEGGGGKAGTYTPAWTAAKSTAGSGTLLGVWGTDKVVVRGDTTGIRAFNSADGKEAWTIAPPAGTKEFCTMSYGMNSKKIAAVSLNTGDSDCSTIGAVDVVNGKLLWSGKVSSTRISSPSLSLTENVVVVGASNAFGAVKITDGTAAWQYTPRDKSCSLYGEAAGSQLVVSDRCYGGGGPKSTLNILDAETGKATGSPMTLEGTIERIDKVISDKPLVLEMASGVNGDYILAFDKDNKPAGKMPLKEEGADSLRLSSSSDAYTLNTVSGNTLYVQVDSASKSSVNAYDLATGKRLWSASGTTERGLRLISGTDKEGKVRAVANGGYGKESKVVTLNPADGAITELGTIADTRSTIVGYSSTEYVLRSDGTLAAFPRSASSETPIAVYAKK